jgi:hypothetical protein
MRHSAYIYVDERREYWVWEVTGAIVKTVTPDIRSGATIGGEIQWLYTLLHESSYVQMGGGIL